MSAEPPSQDTAANPQDARRTVPLSSLFTPRTTARIELVHRGPERFYELLEDGEPVGLFIYGQNADRIGITHATIREDRRGRGLGNVLIASALDHLTLTPAKVTNYCESVAQFLARNPGYRSLIEPGPPS
jgi:predicted GNAT family acetyltransferase